MKAPHPFTSIDDQIALLQKRKLEFRSIDFAKERLAMYGYYNIINGYKDNYVFINEDGDEEYRPETSFEQIFSLFSLDHTIRNQIMCLMLDIEEMLRASASYVVGEHYGHLQADYLDIRNYRNVQKLNPRFSLSNTISMLNKACQSDKDPIKYNRDTYGNVPPWVLLHGVYFSTIVTFIGAFKGPQKSELISQLYRIPQKDVTTEIKRVFMDSLLMFAEYRNLCAHGGRAYNYRPQFIVRNFKPGYSNPTLKNLPIFSSSPQSLGMLYAALTLFDKRNYALQFSGVVIESIQKHCSSYPDDIDYILDSTGLRDFITISSSI